MPRGFREGDYDKKVTKMLRANGMLNDRRSKVVHDLRDTPHFLLFGMDMFSQRARLMEKRGLYGRGECELELQMDHIKGGTSGRCDCAHNLQILTRAQHEAKHARTIRNPKIQAKKEQAAKYFIDLLEET